MGKPSQARKPPAGARYTRIFNTLDSSVADSWEARTVLEDLLKLCDKHGVVDMTVNAFHRRTNAPLEHVKKGLAKLQKPDPLSRSPEEDGRRIVLLDPDHRDWGWRIVNYAKYDAYRASVDKRDKDRERIAAKREAERLAREAEELAKAENSRAVADRGEESQPVETRRVLSRAVADRREGSQMSPPLASSLQSLASSLKGSSSSLVNSVETVWIVFLRGASGRSDPNPDAIELELMRSWIEKGIPLSFIISVFQSRFSKVEKKRGKAIRRLTFFKEAMLEEWAVVERLHAQTSGWEQQQKGEPEMTEAAADLPPKDPYPSEDWTRLKAWLKERLDLDEYETWIGTARYHCQADGALLIVFPNRHFVHSVTSGELGDLVKEGCKALEITLDIRSLEA